MENLYLATVDNAIALPKPMMPCSKSLFLATIFPKNVENFFPDIKKRVIKYFRT